MAIAFTSSALALPEDIDISVAHRGGVVYKAFDLNSEECDEFGMCPRHYFESECRCYEQLNGVTYTAADGRKMALTPRCLEIGRNYIALEEYQTSMIGEMAKDGIFASHADLQRAVDCYVVPIARRLDEMGIIHCDFFPRNIILDRDLGRCSVIDFGLVAEPRAPTEKSFQTWTGVDAFLNDIDTILFYPELRQKRCPVQ